MRMTSRPERAIASGRRGISLLEVLLSIVILGGAWSAISQLMTNGMMLGLRSQHDSEAALRCRSRMQELITGIVPVRPAERVPFADDPMWVWSLAVKHPFQDLPAIRCLELTVEPVAGNLTSSSFTLQQLMRAPEHNDGGRTK